MTEPPISPQSFYSKERVSDAHVASSSSPKRAQMLVISDDSESEGLVASQEIPSSPTRKSTASLRASDLSCLRNRRWLTDAVINAYLEYLSTMYNDGTLGFVDTFWMNKMIRDGYTAALSWSGINGRRLDVFRKFIVPVITGSHWILIEVCFATSRIRVYDSLGRRGRSPALKVKDFIKHQGIDKKFQILWPAVPKQSNYDDCGVFILEFARCIFENIPIDAQTFGPRDIVDIRERIMAELVASVA